MKIAVIADIHGNYPAFKAVLDDAEANGAERYILAGDYIFDLPWPNEVTEAVRGLGGATVIAGNKEGYLPGLLSDDRTGWVYDQLGAMYQTVRELKPDNAEYLLSLPPSDEAVLPSGRKVFVRHWFPGFLDGGKQAAVSSRLFREASQNPAYDRAAFLEHVHAFIREDYVSGALNGADADAVVFGHTHLQWNGRVGEKLLLNPGSCGQPLDGDNRAAYVMLTDAPDGLLAEERRAAYDVEAAIREAEGSEICRRGRIWSAAVFSAMRSGYDAFGQLMARAEKIAAERGDTGRPYSNEVWNMAAGP